MMTYSHAFKRVFGPAPTVRVWGCWWRVREPVCAERARREVEQTLYWLIVRRYGRTPRPRLLSARRGANGRPVPIRIPGTARWMHYSVSRGGEWQVLVAAVGLEVGVDVEPQTRVRDPERLMRRIGAPAERQTWSGLAEAERGRAALRCWVAKEAYLKARGEGIFRRRLAGIDLGEVENPWPRLVADEAGQTGTWRFAALPAPCGYCAMVCWGGGAV